MKRKDAMVGMRSKAMGKVGCTGTVGLRGGTWSLGCMRDIRRVDRGGWRLSGVS